MAENRAYMSEVIKKRSAKGSQDGHSNFWSYVLKNKGTESEMIETEGSMDRM